MSEYRDIVIQQHEKKELPPRDSIVIDKPLTLDYLSREICKEEAIKTKIEKVDYKQKMKKSKAKK